MKNLYLVLLVSLLAVACKPAVNTPGLAGGDIKDKKQFPVAFSLEKFTVSGGNAQSNTVVVTSAGGPLMFFDNESFEKRILNNKDLLWVASIQFQAIYQEPFLLRDLNSDEVDYAVEQSVELLYQTIQYYKGKGKKVIVVGGSYGAMLVQKLLVEKGVNIADAYVILVGRLKFGENVLNSVSQAKIGQWLPNGKTYVEAAITAYDDFHERNKNRLIYSVAKTNYIEALDKIIPDDPAKTKGNKDKFFYAYGEVDKNIGILTSGELTFLQRKGFSVHYDRKTESNSGSHVSAAINGVLEAMKLGIIPAPKVAR